MLLSSNYMQYKLRFEVLENALNRTTSIVTSSECQPMSISQTLSRCSSHHSQTTNEHIVCANYSRLFGAVLKYLFFQKVQINVIMEIDDISNIWNREQIGK